MERCPSCEAHIPRSALFVAYGKSWEKSYFQMNCPTCQTLLHVEPITDIIEFQLQVVDGK